MAKRRTMRPRFWLSTFLIGLFCFWASLEWSQASLISQHLAERSALNKSYNTKIKQAQNDYQKALGLFLEGKGPNPNDAKKKFRVLKEQYRSEKLAMIKRQAAETSAQNLAKKKALDQSLGSSLGGAGLGRVSGSITGNGNKQRPEIGKTIDSGPVLDGSGLEKSKNFGEADAKKKAAQEFKEKAAKVQDELNAPVSK